MKAFDRFLAFLAAIPDPRRAEGKRYEQRYVLLFAILAVVSGANSYRGIRTFIKVHRARLNRAFGIGWKRPPAHTSIRTILSELDPASVEKAFRQHAANLNGTGGGRRVLALDGKALRGSFDAFSDSRAKQVLSAFATDTALVLAHVEIDGEIQRNPGGAEAFGRPRRCRPHRHARRHALSKKPSRPPRQLRRTSSSS